MASIANKFLNFDPQYILEQIGYSGFRFLVGLECEKRGLSNEYWTGLFEGYEPRQVFARLPAKPSIGQIQRALSEAAETFRIYSPAIVNSK